MDLPTWKVIALILIGVLGVYALWWTVKHSNDPIDGGPSTWDVHGEMEADGRRVSGERDNGRKAP